MTARKQQGELFHLQGATEFDADFSPSLVRTIWCTGINGTHSSGGLTNRPCLVYMHMFATVGALGVVRSFMPLFFSGLSPFLLLHFAHAVVRFSHVHGPPFDAGTT